jgi:hypothetical protein
MYNVKLQRETAGTIFGLAPTDVRYDDPVATCNYCGTKGIQSDYLNLVVNIGSLGHHSLYQLKYRPAELWACSLDCWMALYVDAGRDLAKELVVINAEEQQSNHCARARELKESARDRIEPGKLSLLTEPCQHATTAEIDV